MLRLNEGIVVECVTGKTQPNVKILTVLAWLTMGDGGVFKNAYVSQVVFSLEVIRAKCSSHFSYPHEASDYEVL
jgi:hypothetical protein